MANARFAAERQQLALRRLAETGRIEAASLAAELEVSAESVRKDLAALERRGLLRRVHGGAIPVDSVTVEPDVAERTDSAAEKDAIACAAARHVVPGTSVLIDAGSTTARLAAHLPVDATLLVVTNSVPVATALVRRPATTVRLIGGELRLPTLAAVGASALDALADVNVDIAFLGTNGISTSRGLTTPNEQEALVKNRMLAAAGRRVLLADHSKFGRTSLCRHAALADIDVLITDAPVPAVYRRALRSAGVEIEVVR